MIPVPQEFTLVAQEDTLVPQEYILVAQDYILVAQEDSLVPQGTRRTKDPVGQVSRPTPPPLPPADRSKRPDSKNGPLQF